jgi:hypothetical protein
MALQRMDNILIVVDDLEATKALFVEIGMELEGEIPTEGVGWTWSSGLRTFTVLHSCTITHR